MFKNKQIKHWYSLSTIHCNFKYKKAKIKRNKIICQIKIAIYSSKIKILPINTITSFVASKIVNRYTYVLIINLMGVIPAIKVSFHF